METPTTGPTHEAMLAGMAQLLAAVKDRKRAPAAAARATETNVLPGAENDSLAAAFWGAVERPSLGPPNEGEASPARERGRVLERGSIVGRHMVLDQLGAGGMGVVYAAYDPELDRKVALKLLLPGVGGDQARIRLLREAQALGKLDHPNVIGIHDVGTVDEQVWLAMEFVQGQTLRAWLSTPRHWREVLAIMRSAGEGLAAAHAAGLLHRDFKPDNVMVGNDERIRVMDFGLACARLESRSLEVERSQPQPVVETLAVPLTQRNAIVGTPGYMAPEQFDDVELTAAADQFAFCVTLWEALYGERPFDGRTPWQIMANVVADRRRPPPKGRAIPGRLRRACERGLSLDPQQRWPSMEALLTELRRVAAPRRWLALGMAGSLVVGGVGLAQYAEVGLRCQGAQAQLDGSWDEDRKREVKAAFLNTELPYAADTWERVEQRLDEYADAWAEKHTQVCEATNVRQEQSSMVMDLRMECLRGRRVELQEAVGVLAQADATRVERAVELVANLPRLSRCDDVEALQAELPPPEDPEVAARVEALRHRLAQAQALERAGAYREAEAMAGAVVDEAEELGYGPLLAEALLERSDVREVMTLYMEAELDAERAYLLAAKHGHARAEVAAAIRLISIVGYHGARHGTALQWGKTALARAHQLDPQMEAHVLDGIGHVLGDQERSEEALDHFQRALAIREQALGSSHPAVVASLTNIGIELEYQGKWEEALTYFQRALAISEGAFGRRHPTVAISLNNIGVALREQGKQEEALAYFQQALAIREAALSPHHPIVAATLHNIGDLLRSQEKHEEALARFQRTLSIREAALGPRTAAVAESLDSVGGILRDQGRLDEAKVHFERALSIKEEVLGADHPDVAASLVGLATVTLAQHDLEAARKHAERAVSICDSRPVTTTVFAEANFALARILVLELRDAEPTSLAEHAERTASALTSGEISARILSEARVAFGHAMRSESDRSRARTLATLARDAFVELGASQQDRRAEVETWLAEDP